MNNKLKLKLKFKQLFCRHEWEILSEERFSDTSQGYRAECYSGIFRCKKCGKTKIKFERIVC